MAELQTVSEGTQIMSHVNSAIPLADTRQVARAVPLPSLMRHSGWRVHRSEKRADCGLCKGSSRGTVALTERLWKCHRCQVGGDVFSLVMQTQRCDFPTALLYVADYAGIPLPIRNGRADYRREVEHRRQERKRIERSAEYLADWERQLRLECRYKIHQCDRILAQPGPWDEAQWQRARRALVLQREFLLPEYCLVAFGCMEERVRYVLAGDTERASICRAIRRAGGVRTDGGFFMEVLS